MYSALNLVGNSAFEDKNIFNDELYTLSGILKKT